MELNDRQTVYQVWDTITPIIEEMCDRIWNDTEYTVWREYNYEDRIATIRVTVLHDAVDLDHGEMTKLFDMSCIPEIEGAAIAAPSFLERVDGMIDFNLNWRIENG